MNIKKITIIILVLVIITINVACTTTPIDNKDKPSEMIGIVTSVDGDSISLDILVGDYAISDKTVLSIKKDTIFEKKTKNQFEINDIVTFKITGVVLESYPTQVRASHIISIEKDLLVTIELGETVSGLFEGRFPSAIIREFEEISIINKDEFFVIEVDENPSTGYMWELVESGTFDKFGNGYLASNVTSNIVGAGGKRYFGFIGTKSGFHLIKLELYTPAGEISETKFISIEIK